MKLKSLFINGKACSASSAESFTTYNPANGEPLAEIGQASESDVQAAIDSAKQGFAIWSAMTPIERSRILLKAVAILR